MRQTGFASLGELRGDALGPAGVEETAYEPAGYVSALREPNISTYGPW